MTILSRQMKRTLHEIKKLRDLIRQGMATCETCQQPFWPKRADQRYCSRVCTKPAKREAKRKWWTDNRGKK